MVCPFSAVRFSKSSAPTYQLNPLFAEYKTYKPYLLAILELNSDGLTWIEGGKVITTINDAVSTYSILEESS